MHTSTMRRIIIQIRVAYVCWKSENDSWQMKEYFIIGLQLDRLELINYEDTKTLMQLSPPRCLLPLIAH